MLLNGHPSCMVIGSKKSFNHYNSQMLGESIMKFKSFELDNGVKILVETDEGIPTSGEFTPGISETGVKDNIKKLITEVEEMPQEALDIILSSVAKFAHQVISKFELTFQDKPLEVNIEFGVNLASETSIKIVKASGEATLKVAVTYKTSPRN